SAPATAGGGWSARLPEEWPAAAKPGRPALPALRQLRDASVCRATARASPAAWGRARADNRPAADRGSPPADAESGRRCRQSPSLSLREAPHRFLHLAPSCAGRRVSSALLFALQRLPETLPASPPAICCFLNSRTAS